MIPKEHLDQFYEIKTDPNFDVDIEVKLSYVVFLRDFCKYCSPYWSAYIKQDKMKDSSKENFGFKNNLTISDEAIGIWIIKHNYDTAYQNSLEIKRLTEPVWKAQRMKRKQGKHDSKLYYNDYKDIFNKIKKSRSDKDTLEFWESVFFDGVFEYSKFPFESNETYEEFDDHDDTFESVDVLEI